jgi:3-dehydroquinate dehydratase type I
MNRIAASLALPNTQACLAALHRLASHIALAEIRLDLMETFDLPLLMAGTPCPLVMTCRPQREGGRFAGPEAERLAILIQAMRLGCAYVDVEWDSVEALMTGRPVDSRTRVIASRHWYDDMPEQLWPDYLALRGRVDAVKLVGTAHQPADVLPVFDLLRRADTPVIGIAMGQAGQLTRLLAPCFASCLLTYAAPDSDAVTAPGQLTVDDMRARYHLHAVGEHTAVHLQVCADLAAAETVIARNQQATPGVDLYVPLVAGAEEAGALAAGLQTVLPHLTFTADSPTSSARST